ncbi:MAG: carbohydrate binding family 9 domain-containing protein [Myxococcota bacterium]|nr:carbohydrate binding family 9 domain-containing protein [Myxococcota bacterium]
MKRLLLFLGTWACVAQAAVEGSGKNQLMHPARTATPIQVDGKLDEAPWAAAPVFADFVQRFPVTGAEPSQRTELRVLYDDRFLYVSLYCFDTQPELINRRLGRRDSSPFSDAVQVMIDPTHDHRTGYLFYVNAGGVLGDGIFFDDRNFSGDWDGIWEGAAQVVHDGWIAEYAIPLSLLRFPAADVQTWGFGARRDIARTNEELDSVNNPRSSSANVSRFGHLTGLEGLRPKRELELIPYAAGRALLRPQFSDGRTARLLDPSLYVGLDLKTSLTSDLTLNATLNPDFGQVEADQILQNLSTFELQFPEKRPFFTQGMDLFQPVGGGYGSNQALFYSRRIGLGLPILGAAKLTGNVAKGVEVGLLDALVIGAEQGQIDEENPDRRFHFHREQPLRLGPNDELPSVAVAPTNYLAAVARTSVGQNSQVGAMFTSAAPLAGPCTAADLQTNPVPGRCLVDGGNAASLRWDLKNSTSEYGVLGQIAGSQVVGGPPSRRLRDSTLLEPNTLGYGGFFRAGRMGGEGFKWDLGYEFSSPTLHLRPTGFLRTQNEHAPRAGIRYVRQRSGFGPLKAFWANLDGGARYSADGRWVTRGYWLYGSVQAQLPSFDFVGMESGIDFGVNDIREVAATGIPLQRPNSGWVAAYFDTNANRPVRADGFVAVGVHQMRNQEIKLGHGFRFNLFWRPTDALETSLQVANDRTLWGPRFVDFADEATGPNRFVFGDLESQYLTFTLRQQVMITPTLSLQAYAQLYDDFGRFGSFTEGASNEARHTIRLAELTPSSYAGNANFYNTLLNVNAVLRWEYRLGSTLYLVYTRSQGYSAQGAEAPLTLLPQQLLAGKANDAVLVKWSYYWSV